MRGDVLESKDLRKLVEREMKIGHLPGNPPNMGARLLEPPGYYFYHRHGTIIP